ncbi:F-box/kelch-repeat protein [Hibiscus syriacus]|uniref:F-box/kelch-repeat protein n=1 Tax=Hibiscus syriacus TaxID=106335 RepID=A0A6A2WTR9_HIBSY|nr:F-box/kelch-repeat protein [Hibiscus syriacus]
MFVGSNNDDSEIGILGEFGVLLVVEPGKHGQNDSTSIAWVLDCLILAVWILMEEVLIRPTSIQGPCSSSIGGMVIPLEKNNRVQHLLKMVDTTACLCRVDAGLKTVAGAKRYVPGTKLCLQPDIKPSIHLTRSKPTRGDRSRNQSPLLPGLPDDLAIACIIRVPRVEHRKLRLWLSPLSVGGKDPLKGSMRRVIYYSVRTNKWHRAPDMLRRRHFFGSCVINNCLYVAGGENEGVHRSLRSAEVYDPNKNRWSYISDMSTAMVPFIGVVYEGKWFLKGLGSHQQVMSEVYQPETNSWCPVYNGMIAGWRNPCTSLNSRLYTLECKDGCKLRVYDEVTDSWSKHIDSRIHLGNSQALEAAALVPLSGKLCIIRNNMSVSLVDVTKSEDMRGATAEHLWETIAGKGQFKNLFTNLWSSLASRNRLKSHIVHCQVLQA